MKLLPSNTKPYKRTKTFSRETVPAGFLSEHATKTGVWGRLNVETGQLVFVITEPGEEEEITITPTTPAIIAPEQRHHVRLDDSAVTFHLEFLK